MGVCVPVVQGAKVSKWLRQSTLETIFPKTFQGICSQLASSGWVAGVFPPLM